MGSKQERSSSSLPTSFGVLPSRFGKRANALHTEQEISCCLAGYKFKLRALISEELQLMISPWELPSLPVGRALDA